MASKTTVPFLKRAWPWAVLFVLVAVAISLYDSQLSSDPQEWKIRGDFTEFSLQAARVLREGGDPYVKAKLGGKNYRYFPLNAVLLLPFTFLPIPVAQGLWFSLNLVLVLWALGAHRRLAGLDRASLAVWVVALAIAGRYIKDNLQLGQWNLPVFSLTILGMSTIICRKMPWRGGFLVALAAGIKFMPAGFALYFAFRRQWKPLVAILAGLVFWVLIFPSLVLGPERHVRLMKTYLAKSVVEAESMIGDEDVTGHSLLVKIKAYLSHCRVHGGHKVRGYVNVADLDLRTAERIAKGVCLLLVLASLGVCALGGRKVSPGQTVLFDLGILFMLFLLISPEARKAQFLTTFTAAFALALAWRDAHRSSLERYWSLAGLAAAFVLMLLSSSLGSEPLRHFCMLHGSMTLIALLLWATLVFLKIRSRRALETPKRGPGQGTRPSQGDSAQRAL